MKKTGPAGHSPLLGYAFDGFPIYGPLGYDKTDANYFSSDMSNVAVKLLRSGYAGTNDSNGNIRNQVSNGSSTQELISGGSPTPAIQNISFP